MSERICEAVGINLGTTYSSLAYLDSQKMPRVVADSSGQAVMPSVVFFDDEEIIVGDVALSQARLRADRVVQFIEKPSDPPSTLASTLIYLLAPEHVKLVATYLDDGQSPDNAGSFLGWLAAREPVYGYRFDGSWFDIGNHDQLLEADNRMRRLSGLAERETYSLP